MQTRLQTQYILVCVVGLPFFPSPPPQPKICCDAIFIELAGHLIWQLSTAPSSGRFRMWSLWYYILIGVTFLWVAANFTARYLAWVQLKAFAKHNWACDHVLALYSLPSLCSIYFFPSSLLFKESTSCDYFQLWLGQVLRNSFQWRETASG